ncbi:MAG: hypothetical protein ABEH43_05245, partial [Flavobacteriales bacterium]
LYWGYFTGNKWHKIKKIKRCNPAKHRSDEDKEDFVYWKKSKQCTHPALSPDGNRLFFSSNKDTVNGMDLYVMKNEEGKWSDPVNLGDSINTKRDEVFPYFKDSTLFFSSDGHGGSGGLDLFMAVKNKKGKWKKPRNMGVTINSNKDDFGITFYDGMKSGYFTSNRKSAKGKDDIFKFSVREEVLVEKKSVKGEVRYKMLKGDKPSNLKVMLINDSTGQMVESTTLNEEGKFQFKDLPANKEFAVKLKEGSGKEMVLVMHGKDKEKYLVNEEGEIVYKMLEGDKPGTLNLIDEENVDMAENKAELKGRVMNELLPGEDISGIKVKLVNENGKVFMKTTTDKNGNFNFNELPLDKNYFLKTNKSNSNLTMALYNRSGEVTSILKATGEGYFKYKMLSREKRGEL